MAGAEDSAAVGTSAMCVVCGSGFTRRKKNARCCMIECGRIYSHLVRSENAKNRNTRTCQHCGAVFVVPRSSDPGIYCSRICATSALRTYPDAKARKRAEKARARERAGLVPNPGGERSCAVCGARFIARQDKHLTCSPTCRSERQRRSYEVRAARDRSPRPCAECAGVFVPEYGDKRSKFCSDECLKRNNNRLKKRAGNNHRKRARAAGVEYQPVNRIKVFDRDTWRCQVCGRKTPKAKMGTTSPNAPELDHRIPLAMGGGHTYANCQCACRECNGKKGGVLVRGQLPLFAQPGAF